MLVVLVHLGATQDVWLGGDCINYHWSVVLVSVTLGSYSLSNHVNMNHYSERIDAFQTKSGRVLAKGQLVTTLSRISTSNMWEHRTEVQGSLSIYTCTCTKRVYVCMGCFYKGNYQLLNTG